MGSAGRPPSPGFTSTQAARFRRIFRDQCEVIGVLNVDVGRAIDDFRLASKADGLTVLQNALSPSRKLTHRTARIIVVGLFLADSVRTATQFELEKQRFALVALGGAMYAYDAWDTDPEVPAAFIPPDVIDNLAARLAPGRPALRKTLSKKLRAQAPAMARAWCERIRRTPIRSTTPRILEHIKFVEGLARSEFTACDVDRPELMFSLGPEFAILHRERPDLTQNFLRELTRAHSIDARSGS